VVGLGVEILLPAEGGDGFESIQKTIERGQSLDIHDTAHITKSGERKSVPLTVSLLRDEFGKLVGMSVIARDLTQTKKAQQLEEQLRQAQKLGRL
jgi:PAS domain S-box-containing protein